MKHYIVGYMYSGKSTYGRNLAHRLGLPFVDLDRTFEDHFHYTVPRFFEQFGEQAFRRLESEMLHSTADLADAVIATGGGTPCFADNMDFILAHGQAIYLRMSPEALLQRALRSHNPRPAMRGLDEAHILEKIKHDLAIREPHYLRAHIIIDEHEQQFNNP